MYGPMGGMGWGWGWGWMLFVPMMGILFLAAIIYGISQRRRPKS